MARFVLILLLSTTVAWPVPRASSKSELRRLVRLPKIEFSAPLHFDRKSGFVVFPDPNTAAAEIAKFWETLTLAPADASKVLRAAYLLEANSDLSSALRYYGRAADLFRKRIDNNSGSAGDFAGLAESLMSLGRATEALTQINKALALAASDPEVLISAARVYQERAWQIITGDRRLFSVTTFLDSLAELLDDPLDAARITEVNRFLGLAASALDKIDKPNSSPQWQKATFFSFRAALQEFLRQTQASESRPAEIRQKLFNSATLEAVSSGAKLEREDPRRLATAALVSLYSLVDVTTALEANPWPQLPRETQAELRGYCERLQDLAAENGESAAAASEFLGSVQLCVFRDFSGAERSFRQAIARQSKRYRAWELLVLAALGTEDQSELLSACQTRFEAMADARSSILLAKAFDRATDASQAELVIAAALTAHPNDFYLNLSLAALFLKRDNSEAFFPRVQEMLRKAEKQVTFTSSAQNRFDIALIKSISLALSGKEEEARTVLQPFASGKQSSPEALEVLRVLER